MKEVTLAEIIRLQGPQDGNPMAMLSREFAIDECVRVTKAKTERKKPADDEEPDPEDPDEGDEPDEDRFAIAISSEFPVERWGSTEILDHSKDAIDLSRAKRGLSFLDSHDTQRIIGIVHDVQVKDKKLRGEVQFSRNPAAQEVKRDVLDGIRKYISVGYMVNRYELTKSSKNEGNTYTATSWAPMEASSVAVPADPTVGHDRAMSNRTGIVQVRSNIPVSKVEVSNVATEVTITDNRNEAAELVKIGGAHKIDPARVAKWISDGRSADSVSREILEEMRKVAQPVAQPAQEQIELTDREQQEYNLARGIMAKVNEIENGKADNCFELEISDTIAKTAREGSHGGLFFPYSIRAVHPGDPKLKKRAGLDSATATKGSELIFTEPGQFIEFLYNQMRVKQLGAKTITGLRDNISYPKQSARATGSWVTENPGADVAESNLLLGSIASSPKSYQSTTSYSRQLIAQSVIDIDSLVRQDLSRDMALAVDTAAIAGTGTTQPLGILHTSGVGAYVPAADAGNGGLLAYADIIGMVESLENANADQLGDPAWLTTPRVKSQLKKLPQLANTIALPVWRDDNTVDGYTAMSSNQVPKTGTHGTMTTGHALILGVWNTLIIGWWNAGAELIVDPYRLKKQAMVELTTLQMCDVTLRYPAAFVVSESLGT